MSLYYKSFRMIFGCSQIKISDISDNAKLLNEFSDKNVYFWDVVSDKDGITLYGSVFSSEQIIKVAEAFGAKAEVIKRIGLPFITEKYKKRYGIFVGFLLAWAILFLSSLSVWEVRVSQRSGEDPQKIQSLLKECGLEMGTFLPKLNVRKVENEFLMKNPEYSFLAVNISGTIANVEIRRALNPDSMNSKGEVCNVIASKDGVIMSVEAFGGAPLVKKGDVVSKGDVLISAFMEGSFGITRAVHAYGKVNAAVCYEYEKEFSNKTILTKPTGKEKSKTSLCLLGLKLNFFKTEESPFEKSSVKSSQKRVEIFGIKLPIIIESSTFIEEENFEAVLSEVECKSKAQKDYTLWKEREIGGEILSEASDIYFDKEKGLFVSKASLTVKEDIGIKEYLDS